jgi:hypothetical protein
VLKVFTEKMTEKFMSPLGTKEKTYKERNFRKTSGAEDWPFIWLGQPE